MGLVTNGLSIISSNMAGSALFTKVGIGTSDLTFASGQTTLGSETDRNIITDVDLTTNEQVTFVANFSPVEISGTTLREFGTFTSGNGMGDRQVLNGSLVFDGEQELQIQTTYKFSISGV